MTFTSRKVAALIIAAFSTISFGQNQQENQRFYEEQRRRQQEEREKEREKREQGLREERLRHDSERDKARYGPQGEEQSSSSQAGTSTGNLAAAAAALAFAAIVQSGREQNVSANEKTLRRVRFGRIYSKCSDIRAGQISKENEASRKLIYNAQRTRDNQLALDAQAMRNKNLALSYEVHQVCMCAASRALMSFTESDWAIIERSFRSERPWVYLNEAVPVNAFQVCGAKAPSDPSVPWLYREVSR